MSKAIFICKECDETKEVSFEPGNKPVAPICEKCDKEMKRKFLMEVKQYESKTVR